MKPILQLALDFVNLEQALRVAREAAGAGVDWLEAGTPLIKAEGLDAVRALKREFPDRKIVADMKTMDAGRTEVESAAKAGADLVDVLAQATDATILECIEAGRNFGAKIAVDLIAVPRPVARARELADLGADYITVHTPIDEQMQGKLPFETLRRIADAVEVPLAVAGGINSENAAAAVESGAAVVIVGGAITKATDAGEATAQIRRTLDEGVSLKSDLFRRTNTSGVRDVFRTVSTANISDAMHRERELPEIRSLVPGVKIVGPAFTVRTAPGDWAKPVAAIDLAAEGEVLVIDAGGVPPAIWGELATNSAQQKKLAGVIIYGAVRDSEDIREMGFGVFTRHVASAAGEPKGFGECATTIHIAGRRIEPGDWIVGDDDGVMVVPRQRAVEVANRAMDVLERENRIRDEIQRGSTLGQVVEIEKWEKRS